MLTIKQVIINEDYDSSKANNGGGYYQPTTLFEWNGVEGTLHDTSCGDFGTRFHLSCGEKSAKWGTMLREDEVWSGLSEEEAKFLTEKLGEWVPSHLDLE